MSDGLPERRGRSTAELGRRAVVRGLGAAAGLLVAGRLWPPALAWAGPGDHKVKRVEPGRLGVTLYLELENAPFPFEGKPYGDATVAVFVPRHFRMRGNRVDTILHFHGHKNTVAKALRVYQLREQVYDSRQNAILVVPQGPINTRDSSGGKLDQPGGLLRFLTELRQTLQTRAAGRALSRRQRLSRRARIGTLVVSAHSGGYRVTARCLTHGGYEVSEVYLFDSLYGDVGMYRDWIAARRSVRDWRKTHKLIDYYATDRPQARSRELMAELDRLGIAYLHEEREGQLTRGELVQGRAIFINSTRGHRGVIFKTNALRDCLYASRLKRYVGTDWFRRPGAPRRIDRRP